MTLIERNQKMQGTITKIRKNGFIEIKSETYTSVVELLGAYNVQIGDKFEGNLESLGGETIHNISQDNYMDVFIQDLI